MENDPRHEARGPVRKVNGISLAGDAVAFTRTAPPPQSGSGHAPRLDSLTLLRLERGAERLHRLGPRAIAEYLVEVAGAIGGVPAMLQAFSRYEQLSPEKLHGQGGDRFPRRVLLEVPK